MSAKSPAISDLIREEIAARGPIPFARFMELALYHPALGYYSSGRARIGREGDFYTNVSVGAVFGRLLAGQFQEMWGRLGQPEVFRIVEQGANDGQLAADVLAAMPEEVPVEYWIVEPSAVLRAKQERTLAPFATKAQWVDSVNALPVFDGVHFSNELVDALPFHLMQSDGGQWLELFVQEADGGFAFMPGPPTPEAGEDISGLPNRPDGVMAELRPAARAWFHGVAGKLRTGYILVADYGYPREQLFALHRTEGTFSCYQGHRRDALPLLDPGAKDITSHVDFTALAEIAKHEGFRIEGFADQHHFMVGAAEQLLKSLEGPPDAAAQKTLRALQTLLHPESMGRQFRYLAVSRDVPDQTPLTGFRHAREEI